jgi:preprotein translocase subunit SecY
MIPLAMLSGYGQLMLFQSQGVITGVGLSGDALLPTAAMVLSMAAGTVFLVWLGERITENGIGNGISIIIFGGIVAGLPGNIGRGYLTVGMGGLLKLVILLLAIAFFIVIVTEAVRRIPVQYSRSLFRGGKMYRQSGGTHIPMRVNSSGMIPLIFAMSIMIFPGTVASYFANAPGQSPNIANFIQNLFSASGGFYWAFFFILVVGFTFFYTMVVFQQQNLSETLQKQGGFIPGIRPGRPTADYLNKVLMRITWGGAIFLGLVAIMPVLSQALTGGPANVTLMLISSMGLLIVVGVALDTMRQLESQLMMRQYEGFIR